MLTSLELGSQEHEPVYRLSGGTKRRLCVALAFLGSPKLVILDEPGAGVDPAARRRIWRLIDQHRIGRTVILSTHHLDEADILSDTVVVMHKGKILCTGSPLSLKMMHGRGYRLLVSFPADRDENTDSVGRRKKAETLRSVVEEVVANAVTNEVSATEMVVTLPFQGKNGVNNKWVVIKPFVLPFFRANRVNRYIYMFQYRASRQGVGRQSKDLGIFSLLARMRHVGKGVSRSLFQSGERLVHRKS